MDRRTFLRTNIPSPMDIPECHGCFIGNSACERERKRERERERERGRRGKRISIDLATDAHKCHIRWSAMLIIGQKSSKVSSCLLFSSFSFALWAIKCTPLAIHSQVHFMFEPLTTGGKASSLLHLAKPPKVIVTSEKRQAVIFSLSSHSMLL